MAKCLPAGKFSIYNSYSAFSFSPCSGAHSVVPLKQLVPDSAFLHPQSIFCSILKAIFMAHPWRWSLISGLDGAASFAGEID
jgi:hypothetical protein